MRRRFTGYDPGIDPVIPRIEKRLVLAELGIGEIGFPVVFPLVGDAGDAVVEVAWPECLSDPPSASPTLSPVTLTHSPTPAPTPVQTSAAGVADVYLGILAGGALLLL